MSGTWRLVLFLTIVLGIWSVEHIYVGWRLMSLQWFAGGWPRKTLLVGLLLLGLSYPMGRWLYHLGGNSCGWLLELVGAIWMGVLMLLVCALLVVDVLTLGGLVLRHLAPAARTIAVAVALLASVVALWGGSRPPSVVVEKVTFPALSGGADGFRILHLSDVHLGTLFSQRRMAAMLERVTAVGADAVVITGDLVDADPGAVERFLPRLKTIRAPAGVYAVLGNHEYYAGRVQSRRLLAEAGFRVLDNAADEVAPGLWIAGVPDSRGGGQTGGTEDDLGTALAGIPQGDVVVLLQHAPEREEAAAAAGVGLMLNGHTHGGQIWPFRYLVKLAYPHVAGRYVTGGMTQIVSRGTGFWGPPMRLFAPAEIVVVELVAKTDAALEEK